MGRIKEKLFKKKLVKKTKKKIIKKEPIKKKVIKKIRKKKTKKKKVSGDYKVGKNRPPMHTRFKPGVSGNPSGVTKERAYLRVVSERSIATAITNVLTSNTQEIQEMIEDPATPVGEVIILKAAINAAENGEYTRLNEILERVIGKVKNKIDFTSGGLPLQEKLADKAMVRQAMKDVEEEF